MVTHSKCVLAAMSTWVQIPPSPFSLIYIASKLPLQSFKGLCADLKVDITEEDIAQTRQEMWGNFPREIV